MSQRSQLLTPVEPAPTEAPPFNRFEAFRRQFSLSYRDFGKLVLAGKSNIHRVCLGDTAAPEFLQRRSEVEPRLRKFLATRLLPEKAVSEAINQLFAFTQEDTALPIPRCELTKAAQRHFGLKADPFALDLESGEEYFVSPALQRVIDQATRAVQHRGFLAVLGSVGSGKTALRHQVMARFADKDNVKFIWLEAAEFETLTFTDLVWLILAELNQKPAQMRIARTRQLTTVLRSLSLSDVRIVLAIEEAHRLSDKALSSLKLFWEKGRVGEGDNYVRYMGAMIFGQPALEERLLSCQFQEVVERLQITKMPEFKAVQRGSSFALSKAQRDFLAHRSQLAGGNLETLFEDGALNEIARRGTTPLALGNLANAALMLAFELGEPKVQAGMLTAENEPQVRGTRTRA